MFGCSPSQRWVAFHKAGTTITTIIRSALSVFRTSPTNVVWLVYIPAFRSSVTCQPSSRKVSQSQHTHPLGENSSVSWYICMNTNYCFLGLTPLWSRISALFLYIRWHCQNTIAVKQIGWIGLSQIVISVITVRARITPKWNHPIAYLRMICVYTANTSENHSPN